MYWIAQESGIETNISGIGSPKTNITIDLSNVNRPTIDLTQRVTASAVNTNSDNDQITQSNSVSVNNENSRRSWRSRKKRAITE